MTVWLESEGEPVNRKRVQAADANHWVLEAIYPKPRTTLAGAGHKIYPYLLRNVR